MFATASRVGRGGQVCTGDVHDLELAAYNTTTRWEGVKAWTVHQEMLSGLMKCLAAGDRASKGEETDAAVYGCR